MLILQGNLSSYISYLMYRFKDHSISAYFFLFLVLHTVLWALGPYLARPSLPHDTLESITWGLQWQWGYNKHPFLTAWLCAGFFSLFDKADWSIYLLAQLVCTGTFIAVWQLAKQFLPKQHALVATLILEGVFFYNINTFNLTSDTLQSPLWAVLCLFFYQSLTTQKLYYWILTGLIAACCLCTKYQCIVLFLPLLFLCLKDPLARKSFKKLGIYSALITFLLASIPHLLWLYKHDFISVTYAQHAANDYTETKTVWGHILYPLLTLSNTLLLTSGMFILCWPFYGLFNNSKKQSLSLTTFQWHFLTILGFGPLLLTLLLNCIDGSYFPPRWFTPYFFLLGIITIAYLKPYLNELILKRFVITFILFSSILFLTRMLSLTIFYRANSDAFLPNKEMASALTQFWHEHYKAPLPYIAGSNYLVSLISPYSEDQPKPYLNWLAQENPWIDEQELRQKGGLFIWDEGGNYAWDEQGRNMTTIPMSILKRFPDLIINAQPIFYRINNKQPLIIGMAILPPQSSLQKVSKS